MNGESAWPLWVYAPFALSLIFFGLPHGAVDHLVIARLAGWQRPGMAGWAAIFCGYLLATAAGVLLWWLSPEAAFACFIGLTWYHWGQGELEMALRWRPQWLGSRLHRALHLVWRGSQPMLLPLVLHAEVYGTVAGFCIDVVKPRETSWLPKFVAELGPAAAAMCLALFVFEKVLSPRKQAWPPAKALLELGMSVWFLLVHPVFAVGLYFVLWHSLHHMNRLRHFLGGSEPWSWIKLMSSAVPLTMATLAGLVFAGWLMRQEGIEAGLGMYLIGLACLTWPHAAVVSWTDLREETWKREEKTHLGG